MRASLALHLAVAAGALAGPLTDVVDTRIGTGGFGFAIGELNPGAQVPFGSLRLGPDSSLGLGFELLPFNHYGGYYSGDDHIRAFSHTHLVGAGVADYGNIGVMVTNRTVDDALVADSGYRSPFSHDNETAQPGYYAVELPGSGAYAELTATGPFSGVHQYSCEGHACSVVVDACHSAAANMTDACRDAQLSIGPSSEPWAPHAPWAVEATGSVLHHGSLSGRSPRGGVRVFFAMRLSPTGGGPARDEANATLRVWSAGVVRPAASPLRDSFNTTSGSAGFAVSAAARGFIVRVGISFVSEALAAANRDTEQAGLSSFDSARDRAQAEWEAMLGRVAVGPAAPPVDMGLRVQEDSDRADREAGALPGRAVPGRGVGDELERRRLMHAAMAAGGTATPGHATAPPAPPAPGPAWQARRRRELYSGLYRSLLAPSIFSESDGSYASFAGDVRRWTGPGDASRYRTDMSLWDIHRSQAPWLTLVAPTAARDVANSLVAMERDGGKLPRWPLADVYTGCMVGSHGVAVMADAVLRGVGGVNATAAAAAAIRAVDAQAAASTYGHVGWVTSEESGRGASDTMAYAFDDAVAARLAAAAGMAPAGAPAAGRAGNWRNALTEVPGETGPFPCPRNASGAFACPDDLLLPYPFESRYVEGDAWNWRWFVPGDPTGLVATFPSPAAFAAQLDQYMNASLSWPLGGEKSWLPNPWYWAGNEPSLLDPYQFAWAGPAFAPRTQLWVRTMAQLAYGPDADGLPGNDDFGTMSAWQVMSLLGIYPLAGSRLLLLSSPAFQNATLSLPPAEAAAAFGYASLADACAAEAPELCQPAAAAVPVVSISWDHDISAPGLGLYASGATLDGVALPGPMLNQSALLGCVCGCGNEAPEDCDAGSRAQERPSLARALAEGPAALVFHASMKPTPWSAQAKASRPA